MAVGVAIHKMSVSLSFSATLFYRQTTTVRSESTGSQLTLCFSAWDDACFSTRTDPLHPIRRAYPRCDPHGLMLVPNGILHRSLAIACRET